MYEEQDIKRAVRERYGKTALSAPAGCCGPAESAAPPSADAGCGCGGRTASVPIPSVSVGYDPADLATIPDGSDLGLGCGNPLAVLGLREGETVLDLGSGPGRDCFLAAKRVGATGRVIGVDMTPEMIDRARRNAAAGGFANAEFRLGEIENLPVADDTVDAVISNCVVNLAPDKRRVFAEAFRTLKPGGRMSVSDIVLLGELPDMVRDSIEAYVACLAGATLRDDYLGSIAEAGFTDVRVTSEQSFSAEDVAGQDVIQEFAKHNAVSDREIESVVSLFQSISVEARKP